MPKSLTPNHPDVAVIKIPKMGKNQYLKEKRHRKAVKALPETKIVNQDAMEKYRDSIQKRMEKTAATRRRPAMTRDIIPDRKTLAMQRREW